MSRGGGECVRRGGGECMSGKGVYIHFFPNNDPPL